MPALPVISGREAVRACQQFGWECARQRASHIVLVKAGSIASLSVPDHREVAKGTLRSLVRDAGLTVEQFISAIR